MNVKPALFEDLQESVPKGRFVQSFVQTRSRFRIRFKHADVAWLFETGGKFDFAELNRLKTTGGFQQIAELNEVGRDHRFKDAQLWNEEPNDRCQPPDQSLTLESVA